MSNITKILTDFNAVVFLGCGVMMLFFLCMPLSLGIYFMHITEEGIRGAFTPDFVRLVTLLLIGVPAAILLFYGAWAGLGVLAGSAAYAKRPHELPDYSPKVNYAFDAQGPGEKGDESRRFRAAPGRTIAQLMDEVDDERRLLGPGEDA